MKNRIVFYFVSPSSPVATQAMTFKPFLEQASVLTLGNEPVAHFQTPLQASLGPNTVVQL